MTVKADVVLRETRVPVNGAFVAVPRAFLRNLARTLRRRADQKPTTKTDAKALLGLSRSTMRRCARSLERWATENEGW